MHATRAQCYIDPVHGPADLHATSLTCCAMPATLNLRTSIPPPTAASPSPTARWAAAHSSPRTTRVGLVLTCSHLFNSSKSNIIVTFPNGRRFAADLIDLDRANDLAALAIRRPDVAPLAVSEVEPAGMLTACGFGPNGVFRSVSGSITGHPTAAGATYPSTTITGAVRPGDSGGGVLNTQRPSRRRRLGPTRRPNLRHLRPTRPRIPNMRPQQTLRQHRRRSEANQSASPKLAESPTPIRLANLDQRTRRPNPRPRRQETRQRRLPPTGRLESLPENRRRHQDHRINLPHVPKSKAN